jgi:predicted DNA binding CopG/RHH family protein
MSNDRLKAAMDQAKQIEADRIAEKAGRLKTKPIQLSFTPAEYERLRNKADAACLNLQDYIRKILSTYG